MANVKISALPAAVAASGTDVVPVVQGTTTKKLSMSGLLTSPTLFAPGMSTFFATPSSANLRGVLTDETGTGSAVFADAPTLTTPTISGGDMGFSSLGQRIKGDLTTATVSNRLLFQTSTVNGTTSVGAIPNGTATTAGFAAANSSDANNASIGILQATPTVVSVTATKTGTGSFLPLTFVTSNIERMRIDTSGNVNIPTAGARITGDFSNATHANRVAFQTSATNGATSPFLLPNGTGNTTQWVMASASDPTNSSYLGVGLIAATDARINSDKLGTGTYLPMTFWTGGNERVRVDTLGNVGIGTASPGAILHTVKTSAGAATVATFLQNSDNTTSTEVRMAFAANNAPLASDRYGWIGYVNTGGTNGGALTFATTPGGTAATERMRIDSSGNVGIGTASPGAKLDVQGNVSGGGVNGRALNNDAGASSSAGFTVSTGGGVSAALFAFGTSAAYVGVSSSHPLAFQTNNTERMRITAAGNIVAGASAALATTATDGFLYVPTCAGVPTGTPTTITGMAPIVVDTTNNKLYFYSGGAWRDAGP